MERAEGGMERGEGGMERARDGRSGVVAGDAPPTARWGDAGPWLHLAHANGFPPGAYARFARRLATGFRVVATPGRPLTPGARPEEIHDWGQLAGDLLVATEALAADGPIIGVGHSLGAVTTAFAAARRPERFRALVLVDPVVFAGFRFVAWSWIRRLGVEGLLPLVGAARDRRADWPTREAAQESYARERLFADVPLDVLDDYVRHALVAREGGGFTLAYPPAWEARVFATAPADAWPELRRVRCPVFALRGARSDAFTPAAAARLRRTLPGAVVETVPGAGHLLPFERPEYVADRILALLGASLGPSADRTAPRPTRTAPATGRAVQNAKPTIRAEEDTLSGRGQNG